VSRLVARALGTIVRPYAPNMTAPLPGDDADWQPGTSRPGELFTVEGRIRATGAFARGLRNRDPRLRDYRRSMIRIGMTIIGIGILAGAIMAAVSAAV
jgi:hypothetical protein